MHINKKITKSTLLLLVVYLMLIMSCKIVNPDDEYNGELRFTSPSPGQAYSVGDTVQIKWECDTIHGKFIVVEASLKDCTYGGNVIDPYNVGSTSRNNEHWADIKWVVPDSLTCGDYLENFYAKKTSGQTITIHIIEYGYYHEYGYHDSVEVSIN